MGELSRAREAKIVESLQKEDPGDPEEIKKPKEDEMTPHRYVQQEVFPFLAEVESLGKELERKEVVKWLKKTNVHIRKLIELMPIVGESDHPNERIRGKTLFGPEMKVGEMKITVFNYYKDLEVIGRLWNVVHHIGGLSDDHIYGKEGFNEAWKLFAKEMRNKYKGKFNQLLVDLNQIKEIPSIVKGNTWSLENEITARDFLERDLAFDFREKVKSKKELKKQEDLEKLAKYNDENIFKLGGQVVSKSTAVTRKKVSGALKAAKDAARKFLINRLES